MKPVLTKTDKMGGDEERIYEHPAFGLITVHRMTSSHGQNLFGSPLNHRASIMVTIETAQNRRSLSRDWQFANRTLMRFAMSEAQWAAFISSIGCGNGTPITFEVNQGDAPLVKIPRYEPLTTDEELFKSELLDKAKKAVEQVADLKAQIAALLEAGKANKGDLKALLDTASRVADRFPDSAEFVCRQFERNMAATVESGKLAIEGHVTMMALQTGLEHLRLSAPEVQVKDGDQ